MVHVYKLLSDTQRYPASTLREYVCRYAKNGRAARALAAEWGEMGLIPKVMFQVPPEQSVEAKELGARFCWEQKRW